MFRSIGGSLMVFPGDSLRLDSLSFVVNDSAVSRERFCSIPRDSIRTLYVVGRPVNVIYLTTRSTLMPLPATMLPAEGVGYYVDGVEVTAERLLAVPADSVSSVSVTRSNPAAIYITTRPK